jgi:hypothetical protein
MFVNSLFGELLLLLVLLIKNEIIGLQSRL